MRRGPAIVGILAFGLTTALAAPPPVGLKINQIQMVGTSASTKLAPSPAMLSLIRMGGKKDAEALDFGEPPLAAQLNAGARALSFDIAYDPQGGLFKSPAGASMADDLLDADYGIAMSQPGFKVIHVLDVDYKASCLTLKACLLQVAAWSSAHPKHLPIVILLHANDGKTPMPGATHPLPFDAAAARALDQEIAAVFPAGRIITPDQVKDHHANLREAVQAGAWPKLAAARGKMLFVLADTPQKTALYAGLPAHLAFVTADEASPDAAFIAIDDPLKETARITAAVKSGFMVITLADDQTVEARAGDTRRRDAAFASGAQVIETDFLLPDKTVGAYQVTIADRRHVQCDALDADCTAWAASAPVQRTATAR